MTENEKLRTLLAEARVALQGVAAYDASPDVSWTLTKEFCRDAIDRIDAALAEPVVDMEASASRGWQMADSLHLSVKEQRERAEKAENERNEARAEVERLQAELVRVARTSLEQQATED